MMHVLKYHCSASERRLENSSVAVSLPGEGIYNVVYFKCLIVVVNVSNRNCNTS